MSTSGDDMWSFNGGSPGGGDADYLYTTALAEMDPVSGAGGGEGAGGGQGGGGGVAGGAGIAGSRAAAWPLSVSVPMSESCADSTAGLGSESVCASDFAM